MSPRKKTVMAKQVFDEEVALELRDDGLAVITLIGGKGEFPWGTKKEEHRWNPVTVKALGAALDAIETNGTKTNVVIIHNEGKFWSNGMDLLYMDANDEDTNKKHSDATNELMARVCTFGLPTVAALGGHWCAAGGMMGLALDYRVMSNDRGFFFVPGVDIGIIYSPFQTEIMKAKLPAGMHRDVIVLNSKRWNAEDLVKKGVVDVSAPANEVLAKAIEFATALKPKGTGPARAALGGIKKNVYKDVLGALGVGAMGYEARIKGVDRPDPKTAFNAKL